MSVITLTDLDLKMCEEFAHDVYDTVPYFKDRGQTNKSAILFQTATGKLGEIATRNWLISRGHTCTDVDFAITRNKSFSADLTVDENIPCHVKSQDVESGNRFGVSWTFQYGKTRGGDVEIFNPTNKTQVVVFTTLNFPYAKIQAQARVWQLHALNLFDLPVKESLRDSKRVVYLKKMPKQFLVYP